MYVSSLRRTLVNVAPKLSVTNASPFPHLKSILDFETMDPRGFPGERRRLHSVWLGNLNSDTQLGRSTLESSSRMSDVSIQSYREVTFDWGVL